VRLRGAEELAAAARRTARLAAEFRGFVERDQAVGEPRAERLHRAGVLADAGWA
jgi:hypothetical protein